MQKTVDVFENQKRNTCKIDKIQGEISYWFVIDLFVGLWYNYIKFMSIVIFWFETLFKKSDFYYKISVFSFVKTIDNAEKKWYNVIWWKITI